MLWLIFGLIIWSDVHIFKRVMPKGRAALDEAVGAKGARALIALAIVASVVMMVIGYRQMDGSGLYYPPHWLVYLAIPLDVIAVILFGAANSKSRLRGKLRHPMLTGVIVWSIAHLMVAGSWRAIILWGGMIIWSVAEIRLINQQEKNYAPYTEGSVKGDIRLVLISVVVSAVIIGIHIWILGH